MTPLLLSKRRAAALLGISRNSTLDELIAGGHLRLVKVGARYRIPLEDIQRFAREGTEPAKVPTRKPPVPKKASKLAPWEQVLAMKL